VRILLQADYEHEESDLSEVAGAIEALTWAGPDAGQRPLANACVWKLDEFVADFQDAIGIVGDPERALLRILNRAWEA
jgi:hypothetical protein